MTTKALVPRNGTFITPTQYPKGFQVATYDGEGLATDPRWFQNTELATNEALKRNGLVPLA